MALEAPAFMSPVSPTFVPAVSSLKRSGSPSKLAIGKSAAGVSVDSTTNSCGIVPLLVTTNVVRPAATVVAAVLIDHCWSETATFSPGLGLGEEVLRGADLEHAATTSTAIERVVTIPLASVISSSLRHPEASSRSAEAGRRAVGPPLKGPVGPPCLRASARDTGADPFQPRGSVSIRMAGRPDRNEMLLEAALALSSELSLDAVLQRLVELAAAATGARYGALGVLGAEGRIVEFVTSGLTQEQRDAIGALPVGHGVLGVLIEEPRVLRLADVSKHPHSIGFPPNHPPMKSFLGAPVKAKGQVFGNLYLTEKQGAQEFDEEDEKALIALAAQAGVAVENARLHEELRRLAILDDRERIAKELHDGAIQSLFAVGMGLEVTAQLSGDPNVQTRLQGASEEVDRVIRDLRNYIFGLRPGILADRQLDQALRHLVTDFEGKTGIIIAVEIDGEVAAELASRAGEVIQLAREALSNVGRHAEATTCRLSLIRTTDRALLEVDDDGRGFDTTAQNGPGQGLRNLRDRAASLGGELSIQSAPGEGTTVRVSIPI